MTKAKPRTTLSGYFGEISRRMMAQVEVLTPIITHHGEMGDNDHLWLAQILRQNMPLRIGVDTGFVINSKSVENSKKWFDETNDHRQQDTSISPQSDILLLDVFNNAPLCVEQAFRVCPIEMVLGVIEVTRRLSADKLRLDLQKIARVRRLAGTGLKSFHSGGTELRPRAYIVGLTSEVGIDEIKKSVAFIEDDLRPNAILLLDSALYIRKPYTTDFVEYTEDVLFRFISELRYHVEIFPTGITNLRSYLPTLSV